LLQRVVILGLGHLFTSILQKNPPGRGYGSILSAGC
jgi:hypothetical protein